MAEGLPSATENPRAKLPRKKILQRGVQSLEPNRLRQHATLLDWYATLPPKTLWLNTGAVTRARRFYERRGWRVIGVHGNDEVRLERDGVER